MSLPGVLSGTHGTVWCYALPYLEPALIRHLVTTSQVRTQEAALRWTLEAVRADFAQRASAQDRTLILAHCFAAGVPESTPGNDIERDLTAGGIDVVPTSLFAGFDYVALGHIHSRTTLTEHIRYSGAPLYYSFSEAGAPRGVWLVDLDAAGFSQAQWVDLPIPRALTRLCGTLDELLHDAAYVEAEPTWVQAQLTDTARPIDAMHRLRTRFPYAVQLEHTPPNSGDATAHAELLASHISDEHRLGAFFTAIRGQALSPNEQTELDALLDEFRLQEEQR